MTLSGIDDSKYSQRSNHRKREQNGANSSCRLTRSCTCAMQRVDVAYYSRHSCILVSTNRQFYGTHVYYSTEMA